MELCLQDHPNPSDVLDVFRDYAELGAAISPRSIREIVEKTPLTPEQLVEARGYMQSGRENQMRKGHKGAAQEYASAMVYLNQKIG